VYRLNAFGTTACILAVCLAGTLAQGAEFGFWVFVSENYLQILNAHLLLSYLLAGYTYLGSFSVKPKNKETRELAEGGDSGNVIYDYWIGRELNPRATLPFIGEVDIKEYVEMRPGLLGWLILDLAFVAKQYRNFGYLSNSIVLVTAMQALYVLDSQYREPLVLTTMDITTDGFGFMLCFGNLSWVPFLYSTQTRYLSTYPLQLSNFNLFLITVVLVVGMAIFRLSNSQKNAFRTNPSDPSVAHLKYMKTKTGSKLLISGWWGLARHINYFGDWLQAWPYSLPTGWAGYLILPAGSMADGAVRMLDGREVVSGPAKYWGMLVTYFYILYFGVLLIHREGRDDEKCAKKYGEDWKKYKSIVPWKILPGVY
jgi:protein-S-isoprenylcysteine O-methyltransferase Ste14